MKVEKIYFWPQWFFLSLPPKKRDKITPDILLELCRANLYLWRALNIYDDFLDQEGENEKLPSANGYYRRFLEIYYRLNLPADFYRIFDSILADLDKANRQEAKFNKLEIRGSKIIPPVVFPLFSDLTNLSRKSLALGLGPIALLYYSGGGGSKTAITTTIRFFRYALAAKQLSDDSRDWFEDLKGGTITAANVLVLRAAQRRRLTLDLECHPEIAYLLFAEEAAEKITIELKTLCQLAKNMALKIALSDKCRLITEIVGPLEIGLQEAAEFRSHWLKKTKIML